MNAVVADVDLFQKYFASPFQLILFTAIIYIEVNQKGIPFLPHSMENGLIQSLLSC